MPRYQHPLEVHGIQTLLDEGIDVQDIEVKDLLIMILTELKILNMQMSLITDEEIDENEVDYD